MIHDLSASLWWHIYCVNHWYDIAAETLLVLRRSGFPGKIWAEVTGAPGDEHELQDLAGLVGVPLRTFRCGSNCFEYPAIHALWESCRDAPSAPPSVAYIHSKSVTKPTPTYTKWRWMMTVGILLDWRERVADLDRYDAVGCCYRADGPHFAGNWWWARRDWIAQLPEPRNTSDRFEHEALAAVGQRLSS